MNQPGPKRDAFNRIVEKYRGHRILVGNDVEGVGIDYRLKRKLWDTARDVNHAKEKIDEAHAKLGHKLSRSNG